MDSVSSHSKLASSAFFGLRADRLVVKWQQWQEMQGKTAIVSTLRPPVYVRADPKGGVTMQYGVRGDGILVNYAEYFAVAPPPAPPVEETPAPTPSGSFQKRRSIESQHKFDCPTGHTYCWTGERQEYACMDTSSDVTGMSPLFFLSTLSSLPTPLSSKTRKKGTQLTNSMWPMSLCSWKRRIRRRLYFNRRSR